jgi:predicted glycogen debranching enzyme
MPAPRELRSSAAKPAKRKQASIPTAGQLSTPRTLISFGPEVCRDLAAAEQREWLVTNGIGGFASGTVAGSATRRYHGLLIAALDPAGRRTFLVGGVDEVLRGDSQDYALAAHRWASGAVAPQGHLLIQDFHLDGSLPVWRYKAGSILIEKSIWMRHGENTTFVQYKLLESVSPVSLELKILVNYRDFHAATHAGEWRMDINQVESGVRITAFEGATSFYARCAGAVCEPRHIWYRDFFFPRESERGLDDREDQLYAALFTVQLQKGQTVTLVFSAEKDSNVDAVAERRAEIKRQSKIQSVASTLLSMSPGGSSSSGILQLLFAADQFLVKRTLPGQPAGKSIIAGYHWFSDWGRDTMISLPGLALATGRSDVAKQILLAFAGLVDGGMLPNNFPDAGGAPEYNTMDATLWYFEAARQYFKATRDLPTLKKLFPILAKIVSAHVKGTRYNIHVDPADGLLYGGGPGVQLTWMDAKIGDWVVTPRTGKPIEINALWINALENMLQFAQVLGASSDIYVQLLDKAKSGFGKFWNEQQNNCFDVLDSPGIGNDSTMRPNQIFAVSLSATLLSTEQQKAVVDACASRLLTPFGLRSLAPNEAGYRGVLSGGPAERDSAYHQGTVWGWLMGPFAIAHYRVYKNRAAALEFLEPLAKSIDTYGLGTLAEIFDGDPPHHPRGCIAQAWTVGELLRAWKEIQS